MYKITSNTSRENVSQEAPYDSRSSANENLSKLSKPVTVMTKRNSPDCDKKKPSESNDMDIHQDDGEIKIVSTSSMANLSSNRFDRNSSAQDGTGASSNDKKSKKINLNIMGSGNFINYKGVKNDNLVINVVGCNNQVNVEEVPRADSEPLQDLSEISFESGTEIVADQIKSLPLTPNKSSKSSESEIEKKNQNDGSGPEFLRELPSISDVSFEQMSSPRVDYFGQKGRRRKLSEVSFESPEQLEDLESLPGVDTPRTLENLNRSGTPYRIPANLVTTNILFDSQNNFLKKIRSDVKKTSIFDVKKSRSDIIRTSTFDIKTTPGFSKGYSSDTNPGVTPDPETQVENPFTPHPPEQNTLKSFFGLDQDGV